MYALNISYKQFYITLNDQWLYESDPNAPSTCSEHGGKLMGVHITITS